VVKTASGTSSTVATASSGGTHWIPWLGLTAALVVLAWVVWGTAVWLYNVPPSARRWAVWGDWIVWRWPVDGPVLAGFEADEPGRQGLDIGGHMGQPVYAAASGVVVYSGSGLVGYGELIIIKHSDSYLSAYGHNSVRLVKEGQNVVAGQEIAEMGNSGAPRVELHFEIRKDGKPLNPQDFLPRR